MDVLTTASLKAKRSGYYCYKNDCVKEVKEVTARVFEARIIEDSGEIVTVKLDLNKTGKSACNCKQASGKRVVCMHMVAVFFKLFPAEAKRYYDEYLKPYDGVYERILKKQNFKKYLLKADRAELIDVICELLDSCTDKTLDRFLEERTKEL